MGRTPDRIPGPALEEELVLEDRGPSGDNDGDPSVEGAVRRVSNTLRYYVDGDVSQISRWKNVPTDFDDVDLTGLTDGQGLSYNATSKQFEPTDAFDPTEHESIRTLIHFISDGPACGFATGAFKETLPSAAVFPTSVIWWESSSKLEKIVEKTITYTGVFPTTIEWKMYDTDGTTVNCTVTDSISYTGPFETSRTRSIS